VQDFVSQTVANLFYIVIVVLIVEVLIPENYRKYIEVFLGICIVLLILTPILEMSGNLKLQYIENINKLENEFKEKKIYSEDLYKQSLVDEYKDRLKEDIKKKIEAETGMNVEIALLKISEDLNQPQFGKIEKIKIKGDYNEKIVDILKNQYGISKDKIEFEEVKMKDVYQPR